MDHWVGRVAVYFIRVQGELGGRVFVLVRHGYQASVALGDSAHAIMHTRVYTYLRGRGPKSPLWQDALRSSAALAFLDVTVQSGEWPQPCRHGKVPTIRAQRLALEMEEIPQKPGF
jgi:hypothetical protein